VVHGSGACEDRLKEILVYFGDLPCDKAMFRIQQAEVAEQWRKEESPTA